MFFAFLAASCATLSNLFFRKNSDASETTANGYLVLFYLLSFLASFIFYPEVFFTPPSWTLILLGGCVGALNISLMLLTAKALQKGPSGLTFAFQNASAVFPGVLLFLLFGQEFGFEMSGLKWLGIGFVLTGLFLGTRDASHSDSKASDSVKWLIYASAGFIVQVLALSFIQGRCLLFDCQKNGGVFSRFAVDEKFDVWFMPGLFGTALVLQLFLFLKERRRFKKSEFVLGSLGGLANFGSTGLLLLATKFALPFEKSILLPCFSVATLILCNGWANRLYKEKFNLLANFFCALGIFISVLK